jgi:hypothetical protein
MRHDDLPARSRGGPLSARQICGAGRVGRGLPVGGLPGGCRARAARMASTRPLRHGISQTCGSVAAVRAGRPQPRWPPATVAEPAASFLGVDHGSNPLVVHGMRAPDLATSCGEGSQSFRGCRALCGSPARGRPPPAREVYMGKKLAQPGNAGERATRGSPAAGAAEEHKPGARHAGTLAEVRVARRERAGRGRRHTPPSLPWACRRRRRRSWRGRSPEYRSTTPWRGAWPPIRPGGWRRGWARSGRRRREVPRRCVQSS